MTFAEIVVFIFMGIGVFYLLKPLQRKLESRFYKIFRNKKSGPGPVIDITQSFKKNKDKDTHGEF